ncbi:hypothetical protein JOC95_001049 [Bacillus tianshenii]|uniref:VanZ-like domain-containing protein n=1 Tax=Sutcliffiella tianshenii TaxID=1463404 RepID=A0ABS2NX19_9BACI|nr:hypothetical protein [Bacillus tianshenii]MBM7619200.1 hypothetical protein [Bacillus tianshenii]
MILAFCITLTVSILSLFLFHIYKRKFSTFYLMLLFLLTSYLCQNTYYKLFSPYERISIADSMWAKISIKLHFGIILPVLLIGIIFLFLSNNTFIKISSIIAWAAFVAASEMFYLSLGVLEQKGEHWYPFIDIAFAFIVVFVTFVIKKYLKRLMMKERLQP